MQHSKSLKTTLGFWFLLMNDSSKPSVNVDLRVADSLGLVNDVILFFFIMMVWLDITL